MPELAFVMQIQLPPEKHVDHLHAEEGEDRVKLPSEHAEEVEEQIPPERIGGHLRMSLAHF